VRWVTVQEMHEYSFVEADLSVITALEEVRI